MRQGIERGGQTGARPGKRKGRASLRGVKQARHRHNVPTDTENSTPLLVQTRRRYIPATRPSISPRWPCLSSQEFPSPGPDPSSLARLPPRRHPLLRLHPPRAPDFGLGEGEALCSARSRTTGRHRERGQRITYIASVSRRARSTAVPPTTAKQ